VEKESGATVRDASLFWAGATILEERVTTGEVNRFFADGESHNGTARYLARDHLGSIREVTDTAGAVVTRNDYDPYGRLTRLAGGQDSRFGYTGHMNHVPSGLALALYRAYDPNLGRWISEDPLGIVAGVNRYAYVSNRITVFTDPLGLQGKRSEESNLEWLWRVYVKELFTSYGPDAAADVANEGGKVVGKTVGSQALGALGDLITSSTTFLDLLKIQTKHNQDIDMALKCISDPSCGTAPNTTGPNTTGPNTAPNQCKQ
jgi:RHS repeat-associated protein